jgi:hypothetical protein
MKRTVYYLAQVTDLSSEFCGHLRRPKLPFVIHAWGGPKILGQVTGELLGFISLPNSSCRRRRLGAKPSDIHGRDRPKQLQPKRRQGRQSDLVTIDAKSCINPKSDTSNPDTDEVAIGRNTNRFGSDRNYPVKLSATFDFHRLRRPRPVVSQTYASLIRSTRRPCRNNQRH